MRNLLLLTYLLTAPPIHAASWTTQLAGGVPADQCQKAFQYPIWLERPLSSTTQSKFKLFATTADTFDQWRPSVLIVDGGPGGIAGAKSIEHYRTLYPWMNVVFFHTRGAGCSTLNLDTKFDQYISTQAAVEDMDALRSSLNIEKWAALDGGSYGSVVARVYANRFANRVGLLILSAVYQGDEEKFTEPELQNRVLKIISDRRSNRKSQIGQLKPDEYTRFVLNLTNFFSRFPLSLHFAMASQSTSYFEAFQQQAYNELLAQGAMPEEAEGAYSQVSRETFLALLILKYSKPTEESDLMIALLLQKFSSIPIPPGLEPQIKSHLSLIERDFFPYKNSNYAEDIKGFGFISKRVLESTLTNDSYQLKPTSLCSTVPTIVVQGIVDLVTPAKGALKFLSDKSCAKGPTVAFLQKNDGHFIQPESCVGNYIQQSLRSHTLLRPLCSGNVEVRLFN